MKIAADFSNYQMEASQMFRIGKILNAFSAIRVMKYCKAVKYRGFFLKIVY